MCADEIGSESLGVVAGRAVPGGVACRLKLIREAYGISQRELAKRAGVTNSNISMIELGQVSPSIHSLERILSVFPISLADFFSFQPTSSLRITRTFSESAVNETLVSQVSGQITSKIIIVPPNSSSSFCLLAQDASGVVIRGTSKLKSISTVEMLSAGDAFYIPACQIHQFINCSETSLQLFICTGFNPRY